MSHVLIIGGGLAGCTAALELAGKNINVTVIEKSCRIGGKVREYGCKATNSCTNCGLCLVGGLWENVENNQKIKIITNSYLIDILGNKGDFKAVINNKGNIEMLHKITSIIVSIGFNEFSSLSSGWLEFDTSSSIISGSQMEKLLSQRTKDSLFPEEPKSITFIQCVGSRDVQEKAMYCSRVCCGYSTRSARVIREYYPESKIVFFYMDLQKVEEGEYFSTLRSEGIEFVRCRPVKIKQGTPAKVLFEQPGVTGLKEKEFDLVVLSEGIHPPVDAEKLAEICLLKVGRDGFLRYVNDGKSTGIYLAGCASGPKRIEEVYTEALTVAREIAVGGGSI
jgi:heterodisulfide reductase subunit A